MSIFSRGSKKRKDFVENKMKETNSKTNKTYTDTEANEEYMKEKKEWADDIIKGFKTCCEVLRDPMKVWNQYKSAAPGAKVFWIEHGAICNKINTVMKSDKYKNVTQGGSSSKYLQTVQYELGKVMTTNYNGDDTDPENFKSSMQSCGKGLSKLKHPIGSTALVTVGKKGERIVDYVDELASLMLNKSVQENAAKLVKLEQGEEWPANEDDYTYTKVKPKYVKL